MKYGSWSGKASGAYFLEKIKLGDKSMVTLIRKRSWYNCFNVIVSIHFIAIFS